MSEITQLKSARRKLLRSLKGEAATREDNQLHLLQRQKNLYTREELELLDSIYSEGSAMREEQRTNQESDFWAEDKDDYLVVSGPKTGFFSKLSWFTSGVLISSVIWLIYFQLNVHALRTKNDTQIVFQNSANIMSDKTTQETVDKNIEQYQDQLANEEKKAIAEKNGASKASLGTSQALMQHTVKNGDSLWTIAKEYYSDPSPSNIEKIKQANDIRGYLVPGQKINIPL